MNSQRIQENVESFKEKYLYWILVEEPLPKDKKNPNLIHTDWLWNCNRCRAFIKEHEKYDTVVEYIREHHELTGHHSGLLTLTKIVETWV